MDYTLWQDSTNETLKTTGLSPSPYNAIRSSAANWSRSPLARWCVDPNFRTTNWSTGTSQKMANLAEGHQTASVLHLHLELLYNKSWSQPIFQGDKIQFSKKSTRLKFVSSAYVLTNRGGGSISPGICKQFIILIFFKITKILKHKNLLKSI